MRIVLKCERVKFISPKRYRCILRQQPHGMDLIEIELDAPIVVGSYYNILIKGIFPTCHSPDYPVVSDMLSMTCREHLQAVDLQTEDKIING